MSACRSVADLLLPNIETCTSAFTGFAGFSVRWPAMCIHGDKSQPERDWVLAGAAAARSSAKNSRLYFYGDASIFFCVCLAEFRNGKAPILIATDVASRGLGMFWVFKCYARTTRMQILSGYDDVVMS